MSSEKRPLEDTFDRAQKHRKLGTVRLKLELLGFHPLNRGCAGINPYHVHEVAHDALTNKVSQFRYHSVDVVKVPTAALDSWRAANKAKAEQNKLMPAFSQSMAYACLTNTHFTHAMKLGSGDRTLFNDGKTVIKYADTNEWRATREDGVLCVVYDEALWEDNSALVSWMLADNLNASVQVGEDEMQAFGRVGGIVTKLARSQQGAQEEMIEIKTVYELIEKEGFGRFNSQTFVDFIKLRLTISHKAAKIFQTCQQHSIGFRVQVRSSDYQLISKLDSRCSLAKIALLLHRYYDQLDRLKQHSKGGAPDSAATSAHFEGHSRVTAPALNSKCVQELVEETHYLLSLESFLMGMFNLYKVRPDTEGVK